MATSVSNSYIREPLHSGYTEEVVVERKELPICPDNQNLRDILPALLALQNEKGNIYGRSWVSHGHLSAFFNLERKWDRIQNIMERAMENGVGTLFNEDSSTPTETLVDTIVDLGLYALMWAGYIRETQPEQYEKFLRANHLYDSTVTTTEF